MDHLPRLHRKKTYLLAGAFKSLNALAGKIFSAAPEACGGAAAAASFYAAPEAGGGAAAAASFWRSPRMLKTSSKSSFVRTAAFTTMRLFSSGHCASLWQAVSSGLSEPAGRLAVV